ncbi:VOC family protein [Luteipulveratus flavus]|uniref:VOC family protein n=1 Tax=Luteipulveratus flavus TaxID=3031728 RepID=A0ABT6C2J3_9MICO|nr:VOC family protein [Luteipulveratus sp. YIM 133296]MDF8263159.1 VOC family protein [Luteipulveratus sp. YIM 133296]
MKLGRNNISQIFVLDQEEAKEFYVGTLGLEVSADMDFGPMRWLSVRVPGDSHEIFLEKPGPPGYDEKTTEEIREMVTKGAGGGWLAFTTDDIHATFEELKDKGVEITQEPMEQPYGTDIGIRDPFGNNIRIGQLNE